MNPSETEKVAPQPSPNSSSTDSEWEYLNQPVTSSEEEEEGEWEEDGNQSSGSSSSSSSSGTTTPDLEVGDCSQHCADSGSEHMDETSQSCAGTTSPSKEVDDSSQHSADTTPEQVQESKGSPEQQTGVTPMDLDTPSEESSTSNSQSVEIEEEMVLSPQHPSTDLETICEEETSDELDGAMLKLFSDIVRCFVTRTLHIAIRNHNEYLCYGCKISHGSQKQHTCLFGIPNNFLSKHYHDLEKRVVTERFLVAASQLLEKYNIRVSEEKIRHAAESTLLGLRDYKNLEKTSGDTVANWVGDSVLKIIYLQEAEKLWAGEEWDGVEV